MMVLKGLCLYVSVRSTPSSDEGERTHSTYCFTFSE